MHTIEGLRRQYEVTESLHSVVRTMKILSLTSIHQFEEAVASVADYYRTVQLGLQIALRHAPDSFQVAQPTAAPHLGAVVFGASRGMSGRFNEQLGAFVGDRLIEENVGERTILSLGDIVEGSLQNQSLAVDERLPMPDSLSMIVGHVQRLLLQIEAWRTGEVVDRVVLFYNRPSSRTAFSPRAQQLLPIDPSWLRNLRDREWRTKMLPTFRIRWNVLFASLLQEYFFVSLYRAYAESLAAEHSSRLAAMQVAEDNVEQRRQELEMDLHRTRQKLITEELLDIVSGFEALQRESPS